MKSIKTIYRGIEFRSKMEAQWAKLLDHFGILWDYEPEGFEFSDGTMYLPDFYLPETETFLEVKGIMDQSDAHKIQMLVHESGRPVVIGYSMGQFRASDLWDDGYYELADMDSSALMGCRECGKYSFIGTNGSWRCRNCGAYDGDGHVGHWIDNKMMFEYWMRVARIDVRAQKEIVRKRAERRQP